MCCAAARFPLAAAAAQAALTPAHPPSRPPRAARSAPLRVTLRRGSHPRPRPDSLVRRLTPPPHQHRRRFPIPWRSSAREPSTLRRESHERHAGAPRAVARNAPSRMNPIQRRLCVCRPRRAACTRFARALPLRATAAARHPRPRPPQLRSTARRFRPPAAEPNCGQPPAARPGRSSVPRPAGAGGAAPARSPRRMRS
jgi:hypothetical protein